MLYQYNKRESNTVYYNRLKKKVEERSKEFIVVVCTVFCKKARSIY